MRALIPWRDSHVLEEARNEFDEMFRRLFGPVAEGNGNTPSRVMTWSPHVDVAETDKAVVVKADLPGVDPKDIEITMHDGSLSIKGEKKEEREEKHKNYHRMERFVGKFFRTITMPEGVDEENVSASTAKGVITVTVPKKPGTLPKKVDIKEAV